MRPRILYVNYLIFLAKYYRGRSPYPYQDWLVTWKPGDRSNIIREINYDRMGYLGTY